MTLDPKYFVTSDITDYFVDKDNGLPVANGTLTFYRDNARNVLKPVYQLTGAPPAYSYTSLGSTVTLSNVGTTQNAGGDNVLVYYYPYDLAGDLDLYYIVCKDQDGNEQWTRSAWPNLADTAAPTDVDTPKQNQISNPTFTNVFLDDGVQTALTVSAALNTSFDIAPNWAIVISGTGTVGVQRFSLTGNDKVLTSAPYVLEIEIGVGISSCFLRQRFLYNSGLWASTPSNDVFLSGSFIAENRSGGDATIKMFYAPSSGGIPIEIMEGTFQSSYVLVQGGTVAKIPESNDVNQGKDGYTDIYLSFPLNSKTRVSSIQVIPSFKETQSIPYDLASSNRNEAFQGDYYIPRLNSRPTPSLLTGWDFPLNPRQFASLGLQTGPNQYIVDQTIQQFNVGTLTLAISAQTSGITLIKAAGASFAIIQYLSGFQAKKILGTRLSVNVFAYRDSIVSPAGASNMRVYLYRAPSAVLFPVLPVQVGSLSVDGTYSLTPANGWTEIPRSGLPTPVVALNEVTTSDQINNGKNDYGFTGWEVTDPAQISDTDKFAIVVTFSGATRITVNSISLTPGDIPCRPAPQTQQQVLLDCQRYFCQSFYPGVVASNGQAINSGESLGVQTKAAAAALTPGPIVRFPTPTEYLPTVKLFTPTNGAFPIEQIVDLTTSTVWTATVTSHFDRYGFVTTGTPPAGSAVGHVCALSWSADARLGKV